MLSKARENKLVNVAQHERMQRRFDAEADWRSDFLDWTHTRLLADLLAKAAAAIEEKRQELLALEAEAASLDSDAAAAANEDYWRLEEELAAFAGNVNAFDDDEDTAGAALGE